MIPFRLHRRIPFIRRPFYQRDLAVAERDEIRTERNALLVERDELLIERDRMRLIRGEPGELGIEVVRAGSWIVFEPALFPDFGFQNGDCLAVIPHERASGLHKTPDGHLHIADGKRRFRIPSKFVITEHKGYSFPEHLVVLTGAGSETLEVFGRAHIANYQKFMGLSPNMTFLEVGCGIGRDALQLVEIIGDGGRYIGTDVTWDSIDWCNKNIGVRHPNFEFHHFDAVHELYNPLGERTSMDFSLPAADCSVDRISAGSVFTHLFEDEVVHYMREFARVLKPGGLAYATFFLYSDETIESARRTNLTHNNLMFHHPYSDGCFVNDSKYPTGAVAFTDVAMRRMVERSGLRLACPYLKGSWSGLHAEPDDGQEVAILTKF